MKIKPALIVKLTVALLLLLTVSTTVYFYYQYTKIKTSNTNEIEILLTELSKHIQLPNEIPTLATVTDKTKLQDQPFFQNSQDGDKLIIFPQASKAILYRPSTKKIIDMSNLSIATPKTDTPTSVQPTPTTGQKIQLALYNGSTETGLAAKVEKEIFSGIDYLKVTTKEDAKNTYQQSLVIDISGKYSKIAETLAQSLSAKISSLPPDEKKPASDILIILGQDRL